MLSYTRMSPWDIQVLLEKQAVGPQRAEGSFRPPMIERRVNAMVTYDDLIQIGLLVVGIINLFMQAKKK